MTEIPDENPAKQSIIEKGFTEDKNVFAHDLSVHFIELCDACRRGDLEAVQTYLQSIEFRLICQISLEFWSGY